MGLSFTSFPLHSVKKHKTQEKDTTFFKIKDVKLGLSAEKGLHTKSWDISKVVSAANSSQIPDPFQDIQRIPLVHIRHEIIGLLRFHIAQYECSFL